MIIKIEKSKLEKHVNNVSFAISNEYHLPALSCFLFEVDETKMTITASDGNLSVIETIFKEASTEIFKPAKFLVKGKLFVEIIKKHTGVISVSLTEKEVTLTSQKFSAKLSLMNIEEYPQLDFDVTGQALDFDASDFKNFISSVAFAAAEKDYQKIVLNGVNLKAKNGLLAATATNTYRLARKVIEIDKNIEFDLTVVAHNLKDFVPKSASKSIRIVISDKKIFVANKTTTIVSKVIDGLYPDISKLLEIESKYKLKITASELRVLLNDATVLSEGLSKTVRLLVNSKSIVISSKKQGVGEIKATTKDFSWDGMDEFEIIFNLQFLKDACQKMRGTVILGFNDPHQPIVVTNEEDTGITHLILPHRTY